MKRYAARLLFQFRKVRNGTSDARRLCEHRIIVTEARSPSAALNKMEARGRDEETDYEQDGVQVFLEFVGVSELIELGVSLEDDEVWWEFFEALRPKERRADLIPKPEELRAFGVGRERAERRKSRQKRRHR